MVINESVEIVEGAVATQGDQEFKELLEVYSSADPGSECEKQALARLGILAIGLLLAELVEEAGYSFEKWLIIHHIAGSIGNRELETQALNMLGELQLK